MDKALAVTPQNGSVVFYQVTGDDDSPIAEDALVLNTYSDLLSIEQRERSINVNYGSIPELVRQLNRIYADWKNKGGIK